MAGEAPSAAAVTRALRSEGVVLGGARVLALVAAVRAELTGFGPLEPLLADPETSDVLVNGPDQVWLDRGHGLERADVGFRDETAVRRLAQRLAASAGRRLDVARPTVDARLAGGVRLHVVLPPVAPEGTLLSLRVVRRRTFTLAELVDRGTVAPGLDHVLDAVVRARISFLVTGGTGTGKTTLLATLLSQVPAAERVVLVEDSGELAPVHPHVVRLEARLPNAEGAGACRPADAGPGGAADAAGPHRRRGGPRGRGRRAAGRPEHRSRRRLRHRARLGGRRPPSPARGPGTGRRAAASGAAQPAGGGPAGRRAPRAAGWRRPGRPRDRLPGPRTPTGWRGSSPRYGSAWTVGWSRAPRPEPCRRCSTDRGPGECRSGCRCRPGRGRRLAAARRPGGPPAPGADRGRRTVASAPGTCICVDVADCCRAAGLGGHGLGRARSSSRRRDPGRDPDRRGSTGPPSRGRTSGRRGRPGDRPRRRAARWRRAAGRPRHRLRPRLHLGRRSRAQPRDRPGRARCGRSPPTTGPGCSRTSPRRGRSPTQPVRVWPGLPPGWPRPPEPPTPYAGSSTPRSRDPGPRRGCCRCCRWRVC